VGVDFRGACACAGDGSEMAMPGGPAILSGGMDICDGLRESMVGMGVGFGAGRV
jgi:hypothetical protein